MTDELDSMFFYQFKKFFSQLLIINQLHEINLEYFSELLYTLFHMFTSPICVGLDNLFFNHLPHSLQFFWQPREECSYINVP